MSAIKKRKWPPPSDTSPSKLTLFAECPQKFAFRYVDKRPEEPNAFSEVGDSIHRVLEDAALARLQQDALDEPANFEELEALLQCSPPGGVDEFETALGILGRIAPVDFRHTVRVEDVGQIELESGKTVGLIFDRLDVLETDESGAAKNIRVLDYKSGSSWGEDSIDTNIQARLLACWARREFPEADRIEVCLWYLTDNARLSLVWTPWLDVITMAYADAVLLRVAAGDRTPRIGKHCRYCSFMKSCKKIRRYVETMNAGDPASDASEWGNLDWLLERRFHAAKVEKLAESTRKSIDRLLQQFHLDDEGKARGERYVAAKRSRKNAGYDLALLARISKETGKPLEEVTQAAVKQLSAPALKAWLKKQGREDLIGVMTDYEAVSRSHWVDVREVNPCE